ncbi:MAG: hypothetical protein HFE63_03010 [Clostridiales bacterium]|nr:hypothetical protein [Clostridiales bacterium]
MVVFNFARMLVSLPVLLAKANMQYIRFKAEFVRELTEAGISRSDAERLCKMYSPNKLLSEKNSNAEITLDKSVSLQ